MSQFQKVPRDLKQCAYKWFQDREPLICAANAGERFTRLVWLSEGSLHYHLSKFQTTPPPAPSELLLFAEFLASNPERLRKKTIKGL